MSQASPVPDSVLGTRPRLRPLTLLLAVPVLLLTYWLFDWALFSAVFRPDLQACAAASGACWGVIAQKWQVILFGRYPAEEIWRPIMLVSTWSGLLVWSLSGSNWTRALGWIWLSAILAGLALMLGGFAGLPYVSTTKWGGLALTLILSLLGFGLAFPVAVLLALGRMHGKPWVRGFCTVYIELLRALPLVSVLFLAAFVLPLLLPGGGGDLLLRVVVTITFFAAAYLAEVIRGGLQTIPEGQYMAGRALAFNPLQLQVLIILPQAIRACLPGLLNSFVTLFKECSLVSIVSLFELTGALGLALSGDVQWRQYYLEGYLFIGFLYWCYCFWISKRVSKISGF